MLIPALAKCITTGTGLRYDTDTDTDTMIPVTAHTLRGDGFDASRRHNGVMLGMQVRRLTPVECERLQGFPDGYTAIPWRGKPAEQCPDGPRYKALGNSWAIPVVHWIGCRIDAAVRRLRS